MLFAIENCIIFSKYIMRYLTHFEPFFQTSLHFTEKYKDPYPQHIDFKTKWKAFKNGKREEKEGKKEKKKTKDKRRTLKKSASSHDYDY